MSSHPWKRLLAAALLVAGCASPPPFAYSVPQQPEAASGYIENPGWATSKFAVAAANPLATDAGYQVLKAGGSAIDAAIAVQMVLTLVEPQSSGIGQFGIGVQGIDHPVLQTVLRIDRLAEHQPPSL